MGEDYFYHEGYEDFFINLISPPLLRKNILGDGSAKKAQS